MTIASRFSEQRPESPLLRDRVRSRLLALPRRWQLSAIAGTPSLLLALALIVNIGIINSAIWYVTPPQFRDGLLGHTAGIFRGWGGGDSWGPMTIALNFIDHHPERPVYTELLSHRQAKFQYPPSALFALTALRLAGSERIPISHVPTPSWPSITDTVGWVFVAAMVAAVVMLLERRLALRGHPAVALDWRPLRIALVIGLCLTFYLALKAFTLGQIQVWINSTFAIALLLWACGQKGSTGIAIGLICLIKPHYALLLPWAALRREWRFLAAAALTFGIGLIASIVRFGWANHVDYLSALSVMSQHGEAYFPNQSINGLLNRLAGLLEPGLYNNLVFRYDYFPPFNPYVFWGTAITSAALILLGLWNHSDARDPDRVWDFSRMALTITMAAPIAWEHHYGILLPIFAVLLADSIGDGRRLAWLGIAYVLTSNFAPVTFKLADTIFNPLQSTVLMAAGVTLVLLHLGPPRWPERRVLSTPARA